MSNVRTFKCDICGKVYHVGENDVPYMNIIREEYDKDDPMVIHKTQYNHICPDCDDVISKVIANPGIIEELENDKNEALHNLSGFKDLIYKIHNKLYTYCSFWWGINDPSYHKDNVDEFIKQYDELKLSCDKRLKVIKWLSAICGLLFGIILGGLFV